MPTCLWQVNISYRDGLDTITKARYDNKITIINEKDPYKMIKYEWRRGMSEWSDVTYQDTVNYLVFNRSAYTFAELNAYKSLQAHRYIVSGFVQYIGHFEVNRIYVFLGKVKHQLRMSESSLKLWMITESDGAIVRIWPVLVKCFLF
jgi:hypothetical protein